MEVNRLPEVQGLSGRLGYFVLNKEWVKRKELLNEVFSIIHFFPVCVKLVDDKFYYVGFKKVFDFIEIGESIPRYELTTERDKMGGLSVGFRKVETKYKIGDMVESNGKTYAYNYNPDLKRYMWRKVGKLEDSNCAVWFELSEIRVDKNLYNIFNLESI